VAVGPAGETGADVVLCHSVLEYVESPQAAMTAIAAILRPGGVVSVLAASAVAAVIHRALAGHFDEARRQIAAVSAGPGPARPARTGMSASTRCRAGSPWNRSPG